MEKEQQPISVNEEKKRAQQESADNQMAQNPNPAANANTQAAPFEKSKPDENAVGSEITDGEAG